jgi:hypothetical protein
MSYRVPHGFYQDCRNHECLPRVCLRWPLTCFVHGALGDVVGKHLLDNLGEDREEDENAEHLVLETSFGVLTIQE